MRHQFALIVAGTTLLAGAATAQAQIYKSTLTGAAEIPAVVTTGTGTAVVSLNSTTHEMRIITNFTGLVANTTAAHIHCCAVQPANVGVATTTPAFAGFPIGVRAGSLDRTYDMTLATSWNTPFITASGGTPAAAETALLAGVAAGRSYFNLHTSTYPGGELRGILVLNVFAANSALSTGARNAATVLDTRGAGTGALNTALVSLAGMAATPQAAAMERLTPNASRAVRLVSSEMVNATFDHVGNHLGGLRDVQAEAVNGAWATAYGSTSIQGREGNVAGYKNDGWGVNAGFDHRLESDVYLGAAVSYSRGSLNYRNQLAGDSADVRSTQIALYAAKDLGKVYLDGMAAYGWQKYKSTRNTGVSGVAGGAYNGHLWGFRFGGGMPLELSPSVSLTPQARIDWDSVQQAAHTETGGGPMALAIAARTADRFRGSVGAQLDFATNTDGLQMRPYLRAYWHHDFKDDGLDTTATFVSGGGSFVTPGQKLDSDTFSAGVGAIFYTQGAFSAALTYDAAFASSYQSQVYRAKARWTF